MALVKTAIKEAAKAAFTQVMNQEDDREGAIDKVADSLAQTIIAAIQSATITYTGGLIAPPSGGPVTGAFECTIS